MLIEPSINGEAIRAAAERLAPWVHRTPVLTSRTLNERCGGSIFLKCENFQRVGAFKFRGALNALLQLSAAERQAGVVTHSSGNHAQALALAGKLTGVPVCVVMPDTAPSVKRAATEGYGAKVIPCEPTQEARESTVADLIAQHGYTLIHPYNNWNVIAGAGTAAWELLDQAGPLDLILTPCGGGGLLSGSALAALEKSPRTEVIGVEPANADDARRSLERGTIQPAGNPQTIADGLRTSLGEKPFSIISRHVEAILTAEETEIVEALRFVWERLKIIIEPSCAVPLVPILNEKLEVQGKRVGVILTGGNVDLNPYFEAIKGKI